VGLGAAAQYLPPVFKMLGQPRPLHPPQTIIWPPVHTADAPVRALGAFVVLVGVQLSLSGLYLPPVLKERKPLSPPQMIMWLPVHTARWRARPAGAAVAVVAVQLSAVGL